MIIPTFFINLAPSMAEICGGSAADFVSHASAIYLDIENGGMFHRDNGETVSLPPIFFCKAWMAACGAAGKPQAQFYDFCRMAVRKPQ
jgi:hypothetical protein